MRRLLFTLAACALAVSPVLTAQICDEQLLAPMAAVDNEFGTAVAIDGDLAVVGADEFGTGLPGAVYVFRDVGGNLTLETTLSPSNGMPGDSFGTSVDVDGEVVVVGASRADLGGANSGAAYVFRNTGGVWVEEQILASATLSSSDFFGLSVSVSGERVVVGAPGDMQAGALSGAAFVFRSVGASWIPDAQLTSMDLEPDDLLGTTVSIDGTRVVLGAPGEDTGGNSAGAAYVFERGMNSWSQTAKVQAQNPSAFESFGRAVVERDLLLIGAMGNSSAGQSAGAGYVFELSGGNWSQLAMLLPPTASAGDLIGGRVSLSGALAVLGAHGDDEVGTNAGAAHVFERIGGAWGYKRKVVAFDPIGGDEFGAAVDIDSARLLVGAPAHATLGLTDAGSAYVFDATGEDCNGNLIDDACEIAAGTAMDCDGNGVPDTCDLASGAAMDCNSNGILDICDIAAGIASDLNGNGIIDSCEPQLGLSYCTPNQANSSGGPSFLTALGSNLVLDQNLILHVSDLPVNEFGYFLASQSPGVVPFPGGSQGVLCLTGSIARFNSQIFNSGASGFGAILVDMNAIPGVSGPTAIVPGDTWHFQCWHRDLNPTATSNFSDGVQVTFL